MSTVFARRFDLHSPRASPVRIEAADGSLWLHGESETVPIQLDELGLSERTGGTPRLLHLPDGGICEVDDLAALDDLLDRAKRRPHWSQRFHKQRQTAVLMFLVLGCLLTIGYRLSVSVFSRGLAERVPSDWVRVASERTLATLDHGWLQQSHLEADHQASLRNQFAALRAPVEGAPPYRLLFRKGGRIGAHAFSLPDGDIVITDEMIELAADDRRVLALLADELGHLHYQHTLQHALLNTSGIAAVRTTLDGYLRDSATATLTLSDGLLGALYSFEDEHQADEYAISMLRINGLSAKTLLDALILQNQRRRPPTGDVPNLLAPSESLSRRIAALRTEV